ncbi:uncharacterized protein PEZ65_011194 [Lycodopsis pacificus]
MLQHVVVYLTLSSFVFLKLCDADISCTVTQDGEWTVYTVPKSTEPECVYTWLNKTGHVIANDEEQTVGRTVVSNTNWTLVTNECSKQINYSRTCFPGWVQQMATCTSNCSRISAAPNGRELSHRILPVAVPVVLLLLLLLLLCIFRKRIPRWILCYRYAPVNTQDIVTDVEEQRW